MTRDVIFQDPGEGIHEGEVVEVRVSVGDEVDEGDTLLAIETDKATSELPSPYGGRVERVEVAEGDVVTVGDVLVAIGDSPAGGEPAPEPRRETRARPPVPASPTTRRLALELGVGLDQVEPSGPGGRVLASDVRAAAERPAAPVPVPRAGGAPPARREAQPEPLPDFGRWGSVERVELRGVRRSVARHMATSWGRIPHVTHHDIVDITELERFRRARAPELEEAGARLTLTVLVMKALAGVLERHPRFNASLDPEADELVLKRYHHIGLGVDTDDGLIVPVVRDVDRKPLMEIASDIAALVERARRRELDRDDLRGGTITLTNVGPLGGTGFTPLIRHPEVAIVGMARTRLEPVVHGDLDHHRIEVRLLLPLSVSFDHRVNDGADAARFTSDLGDALSDPQSLLLSI